MAPDSRLVRTDALGALTGELAPASGDAVHLELVPFRSLLNVRGPAGESFVQRVEAAFGIAPPREPNRWTGETGRAVLWLGPDEWLLVAPEGEGRAIEQRLHDVPPEAPWLSVTDVSHHYACLRLSGPCARELLAKGCPLDLDPPSFNAGACAQTLLAKTRVLLRSVADGAAIELWVRNSFARYAVKWLLDASSEFRQAGRPRAKD